MKLWIAENIKNLRGELTLTQEQLAARLGCTAQAVSKWENGATTPDVAMLPLIAQALDVDMNTLFAPCQTPYRNRKVRLLAAYESDHNDEESYRAAKAEYEKCLHENDPDDHRSYAYLLEMRGWQYIKRAEAGYRRAIELGEPKYMRQYINLLGKLHRAEESIAPCRAALEESPHDPDVHVNLIYALLTAGQNEAAWQAAQTAVEKFPQNSIVLYYAGDIQKALGNHAIAIEFWQQSFAADPEDASALYGIACLHYDKGNKDEGRAAWQAVIDWPEERGFNSAGETAWPLEMLAKLED